MFTGCSFCYTDSEVNLSADIHGAAVAMIQVNFTTFELDPDTKEWIELPVAQLLADRDEVTISGPHADWINPDVSIVDPESGEQVTRAVGPSAGRGCCRSPTATATSTSRLPRSLRPLTCFRRPERRAAHRGIGDPRQGRRPRAPKAPDARSVLPRLRSPGALASRPPTSRRSRPGDTTSHSGRSPTSLTPCASASASRSSARRRARTGQACAQRRSPAGSRY